MKRFVLGVAALLVLLDGCSDSTKPVNPASVASVSVTPADLAVVKGGHALLMMSARDSSGNEVRIGARWTSSDSSVATVSSEGTVTGVGYGTAAIIARIGSRAAAATVVVTAAPTERAYVVTDLGAVARISASIARQLSDSGDVISAPGATLYHSGVATTLTGCGTWVAINGPGHVLCKTSSPDSVSSYAIWRNGTLTPLATVDTFRATDFRAFAMNDSDEVAGLFYMPSFTNSGCQATTSTRCLAIWKRGQLSFPGYNAPNDVMLLNNRQQVVVERAMWGDDGVSALIRDLATGAQWGSPWGVHALSDSGWGAVAMPYFSHSSGISGSSAYVTTPDKLLFFGPGRATGINASNVVVGTLTVGPFIWRGQGVSLLTSAATDPSWTITAADEINNRGQILATANNSDGRTAHTVILTPTQP